MENQSYTVEVQTDFLEKITRAAPAQALAELIWNSLDADATKVEVFFGDNALGEMSEISVRDNGTGMDRESVQDLFGRLGGSWKRAGGKTQSSGRYLHGQEGRGRFKAFALGHHAEWAVTRKTPSGLKKFNISMTAGDMRKVVVSPETEAPSDARPGVRLTISNLSRAYPALASDAGLQELTEIFANYLTDYRDVTVRVAGQAIDAASAIASKQTVDLTPIVAGDVSFPTKLDIIEWKRSTNRAMYLCNSNGFPMCKVEERRFHVGTFQFSGYIK